jgi:L-lactate dehydrogenase
MIVSTMVKNFYNINNISISVPCIINNTGIEKIILPPLNAQEVDGLQNSAGILKNIISSLKFKIC